MDFRNVMIRLFSDPDWDVLIEIRRFLTNHKLILKPDTLGGMAVILFRQIPYCWTNMLLMKTDDVHIIGKGKAFMTLLGKLLSGALLTIQSLIFSANISLS